MMITIRMAAIACFGSVLAACGAVVPNMHEFHEDADRQIANEITIIGQIQCELREGVRKAIREVGKTRGGGNADWLKGWGAKVNFDIVADEKTGINPGVSLVRVFGPEKFTFGAGGNVSSNATRNETIEYTYAFYDLLSQYERDCTFADNILIKSNLKIGEFIKKKATIAAVPDLIRNPLSAFNWKVSFIVQYGASATPTYEFIDVTAGTGSPFIETSRTKTHTVTITLAPVEGGVSAGQRARVRLSPEGEAIHNASIFGQATANAIRSQR